MNANERLLKIMAAYKIAKIFNFIMAIVFGSWVGSVLAQHPLVWAMITSVAAIIYMGALNIISLVILQLCIRGEPIDKLVDELDRAQTSKNDPAQPESAPPQRSFVTIVDKPPTPLGCFQGAEFYEWIDVEGTKEERIRFTYHGTLPITQASPPIPADCMLLAPGILYKREST